MVRIAASFCVFALFALSAISNVAAHGYLSRPTPRGIQKEHSRIDDLKSPNLSRRICRGEPAGRVTNVGRSVTLEFTITAPHIGMCEVYLLDTDLGNARRIAQKNNCVAPKQVGPWTGSIPAGISDHKILRWTWNAAHLGNKIEPYENCADIVIGGRL
jgi:hypothetical protein